MRTNEAPALPEVEGFDLRGWLAALLFPVAGQVQRDGAASKVFDHPARHGVECPICGSRLEQRSDVAEVGLVACGDIQKNVDNKNQSSDNARMDWKLLINQLRSVGMSQAEIGSAIGKSQAWVSAVLRGEYADLKWSDGEALRRLHAEKVVKEAA